MNKLTALLAAVVLAVLGACAGGSFNLPPVGEQVGELRLPGKIVWHDLLSDTPAETRAFYSGLFGWEFEPLPGNVNYTLIRHRGKLIGGMVDQNRLPERGVDISQWVVVMSVADVDREVQRLRAAGGRVFTAPTSLGERGDLAVVADPAGALLALLQAPAGDPPDREEVPASGGFLWDELWSSDPAASARFYLPVAPFKEVVAAPGSPGADADFRVLHAHGRARAGIRNLPLPDLPPTWVSYLRVKDAAELAGLLAQVEELGGEILVPAIERPGGGSVAVIAGPSGAGIALQTWPEGRLPGAMEEQQ